MKWQIYWQIYPPIVASSGQELQFHILLLELIVADEVADLPPSTDFYC